MFGFVWFKIANLKKNLKTDGGTNMDDCDESINMDTEDVKDGSSDGKHQFEY